MSKYYDGPSADELRSSITVEKEELRKKIADYVEKRIRNADAHCLKQYIINQSIFNCSVENLDWLTKDLAEKGFKIEIRHEDVYAGEVDTCMPNTAYVISWE